MGGKLKKRGGQRSEIPRDSATRRSKRRKGSGTA